MRQYIPVKELIKRYKLLKDEEYIREHMNAGFYYCPFIDVNAIEVKRFMRIKPNRRKGRRS